MATVVTGSTPSSTRDGSFGGKTPFATPGDLTGGHIVTTTDRTLSAEGAASARLVPPGSILFVCIGSTIGKLAQAGVRMATNQQINAAIPKAGIDPDWLHAALAGKSQHVSRIAGRQAVPLVPKSEFEKLELLIPPSNRQKEIGMVWREWNRAIGATEALVTAKRTARQALTAQLLFSGDRHARFFPYPDDAELRSIGSFAGLKSKVIGDRQPLPPVFSCTKHAGLILSDEYFGRRVYSADVSSYLVVEEGDFCYATNHLEEGSIGLMTAPGGGLVSPMYTVFRLTDPAVDPHFLIAMLKTETLRRMFERNTSASVDRRGGLRWEEFARIEVPLPSLQRQRAIRVVQSEKQREIELLIAQRNALRRQKKGLMQKLLTGEWGIGEGGALEAAE